MCSRDQVVPHLLRPPQNLNAEAIMSFNLIESSRSGWLTSSNLGTLPGWRIQNDAALKVVPISIETTSLFADPLYGLRLLSAIVRRDKAGLDEKTSNDKLGMAP
jgi:hypothetical protein